MGLHAGIPARTASKERSHEKRGGLVDGFDACVPGLERRPVLESRRLNNGLEVGWHVVEDGLNAHEPCGNC